MLAKILDLSELSSCKHSSTNKYKSFLYNDVRMFSQALKICVNQMQRL